MDTKKILEKNNFNFKKKFGQNFLLDQNILNNIVLLGNLDKDTLVIEVGVGAAALTKKISEKAGFVLGYEIDSALKEPLNEILNEHDNINIIFDDFLNRDIKKDLEQYKYNRLVVMANLPYYITTPIITKFIDEKIDVESIIVMVQNEVANRFSAKPQTKDYNSLTVFLNYFYNIKKAFVVPRTVFFPKPNIDSAVVVFDKKNDKEYLKNEEHFFKLVRDSFKQKRKTLRNNLKNYDINRINEIMKTFNKDTSCRAETLSISEFIKISNELN